MIPKEFQDNYLTQKNAMKVAGLIGSDLYTNMARERSIFALQEILKTQTNRSLTDCQNYINNIAKEKLENFARLARKFVR